MWARNNSNRLEIVDRDPAGVWADTDANPFVEVPVDRQQFVTPLYRVEGGQIVPPSAEYLRQQLRDLAAQQRFIVETGGITIDGSRIQTDRESQAQLGSAYTSLKNGLIADTPWKSADGWVPVTLAEIEPIATVVAAFVRACFVAERVHHDAIDAIPDGDLAALFGYDIGTGWPNAAA